MSLTPDQVAELRSLLESELEKLLRSMGISDEATRTVILDPCAVGRLSRMDSLQNQAMAKGLAEREEVRLTRLQKALERIERGDFGRCESCGEEMAFGRLVVVPEMPVCSACG